MMASKPDIETLFAAARADAPDALRREAIFAHVAASVGAPAGAAAVLGKLGAAADAMTSAEGAGVGSGVDAGRAAFGAGAAGAGMAVGAGALGDAVFTSGAAAASEATAGATISAESGIVAGGEAAAGTELVAVAVKLSAFVAIVGAIAIAASIVAPRALPSTAPSSSSTPSLASSLPSSMSSPEPRSHAIDDREGERSARVLASANEPHVAPPVIEDGRTAPLAVPDRARSAAASAVMSGRPTIGVQGNVRGEAVRAAAPTNRTTTDLERRAPTHEPGAASDLEEEARRVTASRAMLIAGDPAGALALIRSTRSFVVRALEPEELSLEARALRALGRADEAVEIELDLRRRHPGHALAR